jgi:uncharacterized membrane protein
MNKNLFSFVVFTSLILILSSCKKEEFFTPVCDGSTPTYDTDIKAIIDNNCTASSCHAAGSSRGDWTSYQTLQGVLVNGRFEQRVLTTQDMPKGNNKTLTQSEINTIQCWVDNSYPEN